MFTTFYLKALGLLNIDLFIQITIEKCTFNIDMIHLPMFMCIQGKDQSDCLLPCYGGKGLFIFYTILLGETLYQQPCLVFFNATIIIVFGLKDLFVLNMIFSLGKLHKVPTIILIDGSNFYF